MLHNKLCPPCPKAAKSNLRRPIFTASWPRYYGSFQFSDFVLKTAPNRCPKFGIARKMLYLCRALGKCSASVGCGSAKPERARLCVLETFGTSEQSSSAPCTTLASSIMRDNKSGKRRADADRRKLSLIPCKNTFKHYGKDFV